jgi:hypothetical protein
VPAPKCPFQHPIITQEFACPLAQGVTVRNAPQIHCRSERALTLCQALHERLKAVGLPAFGMTDDLTNTPHNIYVKIQCGGLRGLQALCGAPPEEAGTIDDIHALIQAATRAGSDTDAPDYPNLVPFMQAHRSGRRRARKR